MIRGGTAKRPLEPPDLSSHCKQTEKQKLQLMVAQELSKVLVARGMDQMSEYDLTVLVYKVVENTELDDGTLALPQVLVFGPSLDPFHNNSLLLL